MSRSVRRMGDILDLFTSANPIWRHSDVTETVGISRGTAYSMLISMVEIGILTSYGKGRFGIGERLTELSDALVCSADLCRAARTVMDSLNDGTGEAVELVVPARQSRIMCVESVAGIRPVRVDTPNTGDILNVYPAATGKALLANQGPGALRRVIRSGNAGPALLGAARKDNGVNLTREFAQIRMNNVAFDRGQYREDVGCVASAIFDGSGDAVAALGIIAPRRRLDRMLPVYARSVRAASELISECVSSLEGRKAHPNNGARLRDVTRAVSNLECKGPVLQDVP
jgi:DNA-binding IclR family transcriptional regulator